MNGSAGSGPFGKLVAHISWFAQPAQASAFPASSDSVPYGKREQGRHISYNLNILDNVLVHSLVLKEDQGPCLQTALQSL